MKTRMPRLWMLLKGENPYQTEVEAAQRAYEHAVQLRNTQAQHVTFEALRDAMCLKLSAERGR